jgi:hypothetical protein
MQDYQVHIKHLDGHYEIIPYFCLPANDLNDVIAPSCYSCFDYPNALADLVVRSGTVFCTALWGDATCTQEQTTHAADNDDGVVTMRSPSATSRNHPSLQTEEEQVLHGAQACRPPM